MKRIAVVVEHDEADTPGAVGRELRRLGVELREVRGFAGDAVPESLGDAAALVIMGGPMSVDDAAKYPFLDAERRLIDSAIRAGVPVLGICLGSQLLAGVLGGRVVRGAATEIGWHPVERIASSDGEDDPLFAAIPARFVPFHWHSDAVVLPATATPLARSALTAVQAFRAGPGVYGLQFHLESDAGMIRAMVSSFDDELRENGVSGALILEQLAQHLAEQERLARSVFGRWAEIVLAS